jgi:ubiquinone/menaquinone biosynthesis C-methylase UbiE
MRFLQFSAWYPTTMRASPDPPTDGPPEDAEFLQLFSKTSEFTPSDKKYPSYVSFNLNAVSRGNRVVELLDEVLPVRGARVLDIGAGSGGLAIALASAGAVVSAIEPDPVRYRWAEARIHGHGVSVSLSRGAGERLAFPNESFDIVTLDSVIEHVEEPAQVVCEVARVLRPGGLVYVVSPNKSSLLNILRDPHYEMFGVVLLPRRLAKPYVERVRGVARGYWVYVTPSKRWLVRRFAAEKVDLEWLIPDGFEKLETPELLRHTALRRVTKGANVLGLTPLLRRLLLWQYATFVLLGRKAGSSRPNGSIAEPVSAKHTR